MFKIGSRIRLGALTLLACVAAPEAVAQTLVAPAPSIQPVVTRPPMPPELLATRTAPRGDPKLWVSSIDDYPATTLRLEAEGKVDVRLVVDATGRVIACAIEKSSGSEILDRTTCTLLKRRARFTPAIDRNEQPATDIWRYTYMWTLPAS